MRRGWKQSQRVRKLKEDKKEEERKRDGQGRKARYNETKQKRESER